MAREGWGSLEESLLDREQQWGKSALITNIDQRLVDVRFAYPIAFSLELRAYNGQTRTPSTNVTWTVGLGAGLVAGDVRSLPSGTHTLHAQACWVDCVCPNPAALPQAGLQVMAWVSVWPVDLSGETGAEVTPNQIELGPPPGPGVGVNFTIIGANAARSGLYLFNDSSAAVRICFRSGTPAGSEPMALGPGAELNPTVFDDYVGDVFGRWQAAGVGALRGVEYQR